MVGIGGMQVLVTMGFLRGSKSYCCELNVHFHHIFIEVNMVADFLAKQGTQGFISDFCGTNSIQGCIRGLIHMDKLGIPYIRH